MSLEHRMVADILRLERRAVDVDPEADYQEVGVRSFGRGLFTKEPVRGLELGGKRVFAIRAGDLVVSNVFAWEGAVGLATPEHDGLIGSHRFMTWTSTDPEVSVRYVRAFFQSRMGVSTLSDASPGSAGRNRTLSIKSFQQIRVPIPTLKEQIHIADYLDALQRRLRNTEPSEPSPMRNSLPRFLGDVFRSKAVRSVSLGELCSNSQVVVHPGEDLRGASAFVGLEHVESHTGRASTGRPIGNETGRKLLFAPGQVTYGYLRPYLNKVWLADRTGLCSVEQFVLQAKADVQPELLSVLLRSDIVWNAARDATNGLQLPRVSLKKLLDFQVPDLRELRDAGSVIEAAANLTERVTEIDMLTSESWQISGSVVSAARNEIFNSMM